MFNITYRELLKEILENRKIYYKKGRSIKNFHTFRYFTIIDDEIVEISRLIDDAFHGKDESLNKIFTKESLTKIYFTKSPVIAFPKSRGEFDFEAFYFAFQAATILKVRAYKDQFLPMP